MLPQEHLYLQSIIYSSIKGDVLIAGSWNGEDVRTILQTDPSRNIIVIDSFEGLAEPSLEDISGNHMIAGECNIGGIEAYLNTFNGTGIIPPKEIYKMWISKEALRIIPKRPLALLFLDLDHYQPTKDCLETFFSWLPKGGIILVHDYEFERCPGIKKCCDEFSDRWNRIPETGLATLRKL